MYRYHDPKQAHVLGETIFEKFESNTKSLAQFIAGPFINYAEHCECVCVRVSISTYCLARAPKQHGQHATKTTHLPEQWPKVNTAQQSNGYRTHRSRSWQYMQYVDVYAGMCVHNLSFQICNSEELQQTKVRTQTHNFIQSSSQSAFVCVPYNINNTNNYGDAGSIVNSSLNGPMSMRCIARSVCWTSEPIWANTNLITHVRMRSITKGAGMAYAYV